MIPYTTYKVLHLAGIFFLLFSLSSYLIIVNSNSDKFKKLAGVMHGISLFIILVGGFGLLGKTWNYAWNRLACVGMGKTYNMDIDGSHGDFYKEVPVYIFIYLVCSSSISNNCRIFSCV